MKYLISMEHTSENCQFKLELAPANTLHTIEFKHANLGSFKYKYYLDTRPNCKYSRNDTVLPTTKPQKTKNKLHNNCEKDITKLEFTDKETALNFVCNVCKRAFSLRGNLKTHMVTHFGIRKYKCKFCQRSFARSDTLLRHTATHSTNKRQVECLLCGKMFASQHTLKEHVLVLHSYSATRKFLCELCGRAYAFQARLKLHMQVHEDRKYSCDICGMQFIYRSHIKTHIMNRHLKLNVFNCEVCGKIFTNCSYMKTHFQKYHGKDSQFNVEAS